MERSAQPLYERSLCRFARRAVAPALVCGWLVAILATDGLAQNPPATSAPGSDAPTVRVDRALREFELATSFYQRGDYANAGELYARFRASYPTHDQASLAHFREAECLFQHAQTLSPEKSRAVHKEAQALFTILYETDPQGPRMDQTLLRLGQLAVALEAYDDAVAPLRRLLVREVNEDLAIPGRFALARALDGTKKHEAAVKAYAELIEKHPKHPLAAPAIYLQAEAEAGRGNQERALQLLETLTKAGAYDLTADSSLGAKAWLARGRILYQAKQYAEATKAYGRVSSASATTAQETRGLYGVAWCRFHVQDYPSARRMADDLLKRSLPKEIESGCYYLGGSSLYHEEMYAEAIEPLRRFLSIATDDDLQREGWYQLAWAYMLTGQEEKALQQADELLRKGIPADRAGDLHYMNGRIHAGAERWALAEESFLDAREAPGGQYRDDAAFTYAQTLVHQKKYSVALAAYDWFMKRYPNDPRFKQALRGSADAAIQLRRYEDASVRLARLVDADPGQEDVDQLLHQQALAHYQLGEFEKMAVILRRLRKEHPLSDYAPQAQYFLGWIAEQAGDRDSARAEYEAFLKEYPGNSWRPEVTRRLAVILYVEGRSEEAYELFFELIDSPEVRELKPELCFWMSVMATRRGEHERALRVMDALGTRANTLDVQERIALVRGRALIALERWDEALAVVDATLKKWPKSPFLPELLWVRGRGLWGREKLEDGLAVFEKALEVLTDAGSHDTSLEVRLYYDSAEVLRALGRLRAAIRYYQMVAQLFDDANLSPEAFMRSAKCYDGLEETENVQRDLNDLIRRYPKHALAKEAKAWLSRL